MIVNKKLILLLTLTFLNINVSNSASQADSKDQIIPNKQQENIDKKVASDSKMDSDERALFDKVKKGVVAIRTTAHASAENPAGTEQWSGSGFFIDVDKKKGKGLIITNAHVAGELAACTYEIKLANGQTVEAKREYIDPLFDFAILSVDYNELPSDTIELKFSKETNLLNTTIYSMGNTERNEFSIYKGYIFDDKSISWIYPIAEQSIRFSGLTGPGASGSPVFNQKGEVVALLYGGHYAAGSALPITYIKKALDNIQNGKEYTRYFHGALLNYVSIQDALDTNLLSNEQYDQYNKNFKDSKKILQVIKTFFGYKDNDKEKVNGLISGDIIWKVNGELIGPNLKRIDEIIQDQDGKDLNMDVYRDGNLVNINVPIYKARSKVNNKLLSFAGTVFFELNDTFKIKYGESKNALYISNSETSSLFSRALDPTGQYYWYVYGRCKLKSIDGQEVNSIEDLVKIIPDLLKKKTVVIKFIALGNDKQESTVIAKYHPEFAKAILYEFDEESHTWMPQDVKDGKIKNKQETQNENKQDQIKKAVDKVKETLKKANIE